MYRILSLDGGGIRGLLTAVLLERLETARPGFLEQIDLFAGTSTGGILALGLAAGLSPAQLATLYEEKGPFIFHRSLWDRVRSLGMAIGAKYSLDNLQQVLEEWLGDRTLDDLLPQKVLISSFELDNEGTGAYPFRTWKPKFFHNYPGPDSDGHERAVDVALRTSAAPVYFPIYQGYIDGGIVANNPSLTAMAQALDDRHAGQPAGNITLLFLGTGHSPKFVTSRHGNWGWLQWASRLRLLYAILEGSIDVVDYQCRHLLRGRYHRLDPVLPLPIELDDVHQIPRLRQIGLDMDLTEAIAWLDQQF